MLLRVRGRSDLRHAGTAKPRTVGRVGPARWRAGSHGRHLLHPTARLLSSLRRYQYDDAAPDPTSYEEASKTHHFLQKYECPALGPKRSVAELQALHERTRVGGLRLVAEKKHEGAV